MIRTFTARNPAGLPNRIHDDDLARSLGYRAGLVPGVDLYAHMAELPLALLGPAWASGGAADVRFRKPVYDGDDCRVSANEAPDGSLVLELLNPAGDLCCAGTARLAALATDVAPPPSAPLPHPLPPPDFAPGQVLGTVVGPLQHGDLAWAPRLANELLMANADLPPWIHVESRIVHLGPPPALGDPVETRGTVVAAYGRRGHDLVDLAVVILAGSGRPLAHVHHVAIVRIGTEAGR